MSSHRYSRSTRVNELLREILGDELHRLDDSRLEFVGITGVDVDAGLERAVVYFSSLGGPEEDPDVQESLTEHRGELQRAVSRQAKLRGTPRLEFQPDHGVRAGERIDEILRGLDSPDDPEVPGLGGSGPDQDGAAGDGARE